jgi:hypothetical protein
MILKNIPSARDVSRLELPAIAATVPAAFLVVSRVEVGGGHCCESVTWRCQVI